MTDHLTRTLQATAEELVGRWHALDSDDQLSVLVQSFASLTELAGYINIAVGGPDGDEMVLAGLADDDPFRDLYDLMVASRAMYVGEVQS